MWVVQGDSGGEQLFVRLRGAVDSDFRDNVGDPGVHDSEGDCGRE